MGLTNSGKTFIAQATTGIGNPVLFNSDNSYIGVGDSNTAFSPTQTDLQGNNARKKVDDGYPQVNGNVITFRATFGENEANFTWNEWGVFNAASGGVMLCRSVENLGTKNNGTWVLEVNLTIS